MSPPAKGQEPRSCAREMSRHRSGAPLAPPVEPPPRREGIQPVEGDAVPSVVAQHVDEGVSHLARRPQDPVVVAVGEDAPLSSPPLVEPLRDSHREPLEPAHEGASVSSLSDQVEVVRLDRVVQEPEPEAFTARREPSFEDATSSVPSEARQPTSDSHRDMHGKPRRQRCPRPMGNAGSLSRRLPPCPPPRSSPPPKPEHTLLARHAPRTNAAPRGFAHLRERVRDLLPADSPGEQRPTCTNDPWRPSIPAAGISALSRGKLPCTPSE